MEVEEIKKINIKDGDVLVIKGRLLNDTNLNRIVDILEDVNEDVCFGVLSFPKNTELELIRKENVEFIGDNND